MNNSIRLIVVLLCCMLLMSCAAPATTQMVNPSQTDERLLSDVRTQYRNAALIVEGVGSGKHIDASGEECYDLSINDIYAGFADKQSIVHCKNYPMEDGGQYLLFLGQGEDVHYAEDTMGYTLLSNEPLRIVDNEVVMDGKRLPLSALKDEIAQLGTVISAPAPVLYYSSIDALAQAADEIFIGRVAKLPPLSKWPFSIRDGGTVEKALYDAAVATVEVFGSIKGAFARYGEQIELVYSPESDGAMLDAATLQSTGYAPVHAPELKENEVYLFFLKGSPDSKQSFYFPINAIQGFVHVSDDDILVSPSNTPLRPFSTLTELVDALHGVLNWRQPGNDDAPLLIIEEAS